MGAPAGAVAAAARASGLMLEADAAQSVSGGCINAAWRIPSPAGTVFLKTNRASGREMFDAEAAGLRSLREARALDEPMPTLVGGDDAWQLFGCQGARRHAGRLPEPPLRCRPARRWT